MPSAGLALILLLGSLTVGVVGVWQYYQGWATKAEAARRARIHQGDSPKGRLHERAEELIRRSPLGPRLEVALAAAGAEIPATKAAGIGAGTFLAGTALAATLFPLPMAVLAGAAALYGCWLYLQRLRNGRIEQFLTQLPDLARVLSNCSQAGLSLRSAMEMSAVELDAPAGSEMEAVSQELRIGQSIERALSSLEQRMPSREVGVLVATLAIQQRAGGDLVQALRDMAETLEARKNLRREVRTIMSGAVYTSYIVAVLGIGSLVLVNAITPGALQAMADSWLGRIAFLVAGGLYALGFLLIRRTTRIDT